MTIKPAERNYTLLTTTKNQVYVGIVDYADEHTPNLVANAVVGNVFVDGKRLAPTSRGGRTKQAKASAHWGWGYMGTGPSDLAHAILCKEFSLAIAELLHQDFKEWFIRGLPAMQIDDPDRTGIVAWTLTSRQIHAWLGGVLRAPADRLLREDVQEELRCAVRCLNISDQGRFASQE